MYRALLNGKINTQTSYVSTYMYVYVYIHIHTSISVYLSVFLSRHFRVISSRDFYFHCFAPKFSVLVG